MTASTRARRQRGDELTRAPIATPMAAPEAPPSRFLSSTGPSSISKPLKSSRPLIALVDATVRDFGGVDVIVHSAADIPQGGLGQVSDEAMEAGFASIAKAAWWLLDAARPHLSEARDGGRFIAIGSVAGIHTVVPNMTVYGMAKAALDAFVRGAAADVVSENISVNAVNPGLIASARARAVLGDEGLEAYGAAVPVGRAGTLDDVAHACLFLASAASSFITGSSLKLDGGSTIAPPAGRSELMQERLKAAQTRQAQGLGQ